MSTMDPLLRTVQPFKWRRKRKPLSEEVKNTYRALTFTLAIMILALSGIYLYTNSLQPAKGYQLKQLQLDYESLQSDLRKLEKKVIEAQSFLQIEGSATIDDMSEVTSEETSFWEDNTYAKSHVE